MLEPNFANPNAARFFPPISTVCPPSVLPSGGRTNDIVGAAPKADAANSTGRLNKTMRLKFIRFLSGDETSSILLCAFSVEMNYPQAEHLEGSRSPND